MTVTAATHASPSTSLRLLVTAVELAADDVITITLADPEGQPLPEWTPGAHLEIELPSGLRRQYSLCGAPRDDRRYQVAVLREAGGRGGSRELHDTGLVGRRLDVRGPRSNFELRPADRYVFIAGGIGVTPLLAMVRHLGTSVPWTMHYGGRSRRSMAYVDDLLALGGERVVLSPQDEVGLLDVDAIVATAGGGAAVYCCGPPALITAVQEAAGRLVPGTTVAVERFTASGTDGPPAPPDGDTAFQLELRRSGVTLTVPPDRSTLQVILEVVPDTPWACEDGYCGSCEVDVVSGTPDHRDEVLSPQERAGGRTMFPCVSRSLSDLLVLDL